MNKGKRYDGTERKLNYKKVLAAIIVLVVLIMIIITVTKLVNNETITTKVDTTNYFSSYSAGKWGVINNFGQTVIEPTYDEMIIVPNKEEPVFICIYDVNDETGEYKTKAINNNNEEILGKYDKIEPIDNYDSKQNVWYEGNILRAIKDGKYGLINFKGEEILSFEYDSIVSLKGVISNILIKKGDKVGLVNEKGQSIIPVEYKEIRTLKEGYKNEYIIIDKNGKQGIISTSSKVIVEAKYEEIKYLASSEIYSVKENGNLKLINTDGKTLINGKYDEFVQVKGDNVIVKKDGKYGLIEKEGTEIIKPSYEDLVYAFENNYIAKKNGKYGIIDDSNKEVLDFKYKNIYYVESGNFIRAEVSSTKEEIFDSNMEQKLKGLISDINSEKGYIKIYTEGTYKYYNFKFEEKKVTDILTSNTMFVKEENGKYGYVDGSGNKVVLSIYEDAAEQNQYGFAAVKKDGKWGAIDKGGKLVANLSVNLDNSIYTEFIGEWHLDNTGLFYIK